MHRTCFLQNNSSALNLCPCRTFWQDVKRPSACRHVLGSSWSASAPRSPRSPALRCPALETPAPASPRRSPPRFHRRNPTPSSPPSTARLLPPGLQQTTASRRVMNVRRMKVRSQTTEPWSCPVPRRHLPFPCCRPKPWRRRAASSNFSSSNERRPR